jgi:hypothetical protein
MDFLPFPPAVCRGTPLFGLPCFALQSRMVIYHGCSQGCKFFCDFFGW